MTAAEVAGETPRLSLAGVPIRSLWALLVYAHNLADFLDRFDAEVDGAADLPELLARLLVVVTERRLRRELSRAYLPRAEVLDRVRGRIDVLATERGRLLERGRVACRFHALTPDTPRNRLVRAALERCGAMVGDRGLARECRVLAREMALRGVRGGAPSRAELARDQVARHDGEDRLLVTVARLALEQVLPGEQAGDARATALQRHEKLLSDIFEAAVAGFYRHHLHGRDGWTVRAQRWLLWRAEAPTRGFRPLMPEMRTDVVLERGDGRLVIDTKFTGVVVGGCYGGERFKTQHIYQMYAYLRSQEGRGLRADRAAGLLLYPALHLQEPLTEAATLHGHRLAFATVDLGEPPAAWGARLLQLASLANDSSTAFNTPLACSQYPQVNFR